MPPGPGEPRVPYRRILAATILAVMAGGAALAATAQSDGPAPDRGKRGMLARLDSNGDGVIQESEVVAVRAKAFSRLDANGDGTISQAEFEAPAVARFARLDSNGDGAIAPD